MGFSYDYNLQKWRTIIRSLWRSSIFEHAKRVEPRKPTSEQAVELLVNKWNGRLQFYTNTTVCHPWSRQLERRKTSSSVKTECAGEERGLTNSRLRSNSVISELGRGVKYSDRVRPPPATHKRSPALKWDRMRGVDGWGAVFNRVATATVITRSWCGDLELVPSGFFSPTTWTFYSNHFFVRHFNNSVACSHNCLCWVKLILFSQFYKSDKGFILCLIFRLSTIRSILGCF